MLLDRKLSSEGGNQQGSALLAALGLTAVAAVIAIVVTSTSLFSVGYTTSTLAAVQSQAAAEAGVDFAAASISSLTTACQSTYSSSSAPKFTVAVSYSEVNPVPSPIPSTGLTWLSGCPTLAATLVKFVSTGTASNPGLVGNSGGNTRRVEAVYPFRPNPAGTGAALYSFAQTDQTATNLTLTTGASASPSIQYYRAPNGLICTSAGNIIHGNLIVGSGNVSIGTQCTIDGSLSTGGLITSMAGTVVGNVTSSAPSTTAAPAISVTNNGTVLGDVYAAGPVSVDGTVRNVVAGPGLGTTSITAMPTGSVTVAGTVTGRNLVRARIFENQTGMVAPPAPFVPGWVDYPYSAADWSGYTEFVLPANQCDKVSVASAMTTLLLASTPQIFNALACTSAASATNPSGGGPNFDNLPPTMTLKSNLVIVATSLKFASSGNSFVANSVAPHKKLWLIIPDRGLTGTDLTANRQPDCLSSQAISVGKLTIAVPGNVDGMIYSPCPITNSPVSWQGQIYTNGMSMSNGFQLSYVPMGLPGYDLTTGGGSSGAAPGVLGTRSSIRNIF